MAISQHLCDLCNFEIQSDHLYLNFTMFASRSLTSSFMEVHVSKLVAYVHLIVVF